MTVTNMSLQVGGAVAYWEHAPSYNRAKVVMHFARLGLSQFAPGERADKDCLREACSLRFTAPKGVKVTIDDCDNDDENVTEFAVNERAVKVARKPGDQTATCTHVVTGTRCPSSAGYDISSTPWVSGEEVALTDLFNKEKEIISAAQMTGAILGVLNSWAGCRTLRRKGGGLYWIAEDRISAFRDLAAAVEDSAQTGKAGVYSLKVAMDSESVRAIGDALVAETEARIDEIEREIETAEAEGLDGFSLKKCEYRQKVLDELQAELANHVVAFSDPRTQLQERLDRVNEHLATVTILTGAAHQREQEPQTSAA